MGIPGAEHWQASTSHRDVPTCPREAGCAHGDDMPKGSCGYQPDVMKEEEPEVTSRRGARTGRQISQGRTFSGT